MVGIPYISQQKCSRIRGANNAKRKTEYIVKCGKGSYHTEESNKAIRSN